MFWADTGMEPHIERAFMSGRSRGTVVSSGLTSPVAIALDIDARRLFWIDAQLDKVLRVKWFSPALVFGAFVC